MSEVKKDEYIEINLSKMFMGFLVALYKNAKILISTFILFSLVALVVSFIISRPTYAVKQMIQTPSYFNGSSEKNILDRTKINVILQSMLKQIQDDNPDNKILQDTVILYPFYNYEGTGDDKKIIKDDNYNLKQKYDQQKLFFTLFVASKNANTSDVEKVYNDLLSKFSDSQVIKKQISLWERSLKTKLKLDNDNLSRNEELLKQNQKFLMDLISKQTSILGMDGQSQSMILKYIGNIDGYQKKIFSLQDSIAVIKLELDNVEAKLSSFGKSYSIKINNASMVKTFIMGVLLSLLLAIVVALIAALFKKVVIEANKKD